MIMILIMIMMGTTMTIVVLIISYNLKSHFTKKETSVEKQFLSCGTFFFISIFCCSVVVSESINLGHLLWQNVAGAFDS
jgi:hypothetical protein